MEVPRSPNSMLPSYFLKLLCSQPSAEPRGISHMKGSCQMKSDSCMEQHRQDGAVPLLQSPPHCQAVNADREEAARSISFQRSLDNFFSSSFLKQPNIREIQHRLRASPIIYAFPSTCKSICPCTHRQEDLWQPGHPPIICFCSCGGAAASMDAVSGSCPWTCTAGSPTCTKKYREEQQSGWKQNTSWPTGTVLIFGCKDAQWGILSSRATTAKSGTACLDPSANFWGKPEPGITSTVLQDEHLELRKGFHHTS